MLNKNVVMLKVMLPDEVKHNLQPVMRSGETVVGTEAESGIRTLRFFVYDDTDAIEVYKCVEIENDWTSSDAAWDAIDKSLRVSVTVGTKKIYCIANWAVTSTAEMPLIDETTASSVTNLLSRIRVHQNVTPSNPPVMTGVVTETIDGNRQDLKIQLRRQIARVELCPKISEDLALLGANVSITGVKFKNLATHAYLFPQASLSSPASNGVWNQTAFAGDTLALTGKATDYGTTYYIPEYVPADGSKATVMVVRVKYNGTTVYYNVVLDPSVSINYPHKAYTIERNHTYLYNLTILGKGSETETRAVADTRKSVDIVYELDIKE
jgi:hypothetical protein